MYKQDARASNKDFMSLLVNPYIQLATRCQKLQNGKKPSCIQGINYTTTFVLVSSVFEQITIHPDGISLQYDIANYVATLDT